MCAKSTKSSRKKKPEKAIDRPFESKVLERAEELARHYRILLEEEEDQQYVGTVLEMPTVSGVGNTPDECVREARGLLVTALAAMLEAGEEPPPPASEAKRTEQVNVRLTSGEKYRLEEAARQSGFRGISEYIRRATLEKLRSG